LSGLRGEADLQRTCSELPSLTLSGQAQLVPWWNFDCPKIPDWVF